MASNLLDRLGEMDVPPVPVNFHREVHRRLNLRLMLAQFLDLALRGAPSVMLEFARPVVGLIVHTLAGRYELDRGDPPDSAADRPES